MLLYAVAGHYIAIREQVDDQDMAYEQVFTFLQWTKRQGYGLPFSLHVQNDSAMWDTEGWMIDCAVPTMRLSSSRAYFQGAKVDHSTLWGRGLVSYQMDIREPLHTFLLGGEWIEKSVSIKHFARQSLDASAIWEGYTSGGGRLISLARLIKSWAFWVRVVGHVLGLDVHADQITSYLMP
jgi:hypothetical protein